MAKKNKLTKSKSIYTIKNRHSVTNGGIIYENDHFTIIPNDGIFDEDGDATIFSESNFKYRVNSNNNSKKRHVRGEYVKKDNDSDTDVWTLESIGEYTSTANDSKIILKPNYSSLKDFAYYGSAVELIKATVQDVIKRFPGGLSYKNDKFSTPIKIGEKEYYFISNEFGIDCWTGGGLIPSNAVKNPMRILAASYKNYITKDGKECSCPVFKDNGSTCLGSIIGTTDFGAGTFYVYMDKNSEKHLVTDEKTEKGVIIKPKQEFIDEFWDSIDDFERVLLNRETTPVYKAVFETPYFTEKGFFYENKNYIWPTVGGDNFTPDLSSVAFQMYLSSLLSLAEYHDTYDSDNIWRMMTHESIKNLDWTHTSYDGETKGEISDLDTKGISAMLRVYGRQFDDIKRYADNIKCSGTISYDEKNNMPDYFLSDTAENDGWEAKNISPNITFEKTEDKNSGEIELQYKKVNSKFLRCLSLSSNYIQSLKGTRRGIESILGMFGYSYDYDGNGSAGTYTIDESTVIFSGLSYGDSFQLRSFYDNVYDVEGIPHLMYGFPVALIASKEGEFEDYIVPWFNGNKKDFYFQSKGGWGKVKDKKINLPSLTTATTLTSNGVVPIYGETQPYMKFANTIYEMLLISNSETYENMICYVADISNIEEEYTPKDDNESKNYSHYFSLKNRALVTHCGFLSNDMFNCYGWKNIHTEEIMACNDAENGGTSDGQRVVYLESLKAEYKGNNPHIGFGHYDDGETYLEKYTNLFKKDFEKGKFDFIEETYPEEYEKVANGYGFEILGVLTDNKKCAYFLDYTEDAYRLENNLPILEPYGDAVDNVSDWNSKSYNTILFPDTPDGIDGVADESQANGVMNVKNIVINFNINGNEYLKDYIQTIVLKYLEQMIPSTAILEYRFDGEAPYTIEPVTFGESTFKFIRTAHAAINNEDETITVWRDYPIPISEM